MPAIRSSKGKAPDDNNNNNNLNNNDKGKGKAPATRPRKAQNNNVDPCEICGVVVSRKSDMARHAKIHGSDSEKLPCPWEGCTYSARQKTNLNTHYRRHTQEKDCICKDDPEKCDFDCVDAASLLRHRKRFHGYIPGSAPRKKRVKKPRKKRVPIRVIRGIEGDSPGSASAAALSQFHTFSSAEASTSGSSSSRPFSTEVSMSGLSSSRPLLSAEGSTSGSYSSRQFFTGASTSRSSSSRFFAEASTSGSSSLRPLSPPESPTPSPSPPNSLSESESSSSSSSSSPAASGSQPRRQSRFRNYSPAHSSGESEVSPTTPVTSTFPHEFTQGGPSSTVLSMTSYAVYGRSMAHHNQSLLFASPIKDSESAYVYVDPSCPLPSEVLNGSWVNSWRSESETFGYQDQQPVEVVYDTVSMEHELLSPLLPDKGKEWAEASMAGSLLGQDGLPLVEEQQQHPIHLSSFHNPPIESFHSYVYNYHHDHHSQPTTTPPSPHGLCPTHLECDCCYRSPGSSQFPSPFEVAAANLDMLMSLDVDDQSYCGTGTGDMPSYGSHGFGNISSLCSFVYNMTFRVLLLNIHCKFSIYRDSASPDTGGP